MNIRKYSYAGPTAHLALIHAGSGQKKITSENDVLVWIRESMPRMGSAGAVTTTFIINEAMELWIADRHSEHVVCASGGDVLAAGEMTFAVDRRGVSVTGVTNQSTGYCPEPECWLVVDQVLTSLRLEHPGEFSDVFVFRRCDQCGTINIIKDNWFECPCGAPLSKEWNCARQR